MTLNIRKGERADAVWISNLLKDGSRDGHFLYTVAHQADDLLESIFQNGGLSIFKLRDNLQEPVAQFVKADILVAELYNSAASFLILLIENNKIELHLAATKKQFRRKGCFSALVEHVIKNYRGSYKIFARCYKKSTWAIKALKSKGFVITSTNNDPIELSLV